MAIDLSLSENDDASRTRAGIQGCLKTMHFKKSNVEVQ
jgi:hypothetical protein